MSFMGNITHFFSYFIPFQTHCDYSVYRYYIAEEDAPKFILKTFLKIKSTFLIKFSLNKDKHTHKTYLLQKPLSSFSFEERETFIVVLKTTSNPDLGIFLILLFLQHLSSFNIIGPGHLVHYFQKCHFQISSVKIFSYYHFHF